MADPTTAYTGLGALKIYYGDATQASGAGIVDLGVHEDVTVSANIVTAFSNSANTGDVALASSLRGLAPAPVASVQLYDQQIQNLADILREQAEILETGTDPDIVQALVLRANTKFITHGQLALIPAFEADQGAAAPHGVWLPKAYVQNLGDLFTFGRLQEGANNNPFTVDFGVAVDAPSDIVALYGDPAAANKTWSLPPVA